VRVAAEREREARPVRASKRYGARPALAAAFSAVAILAGGAYAVPVTRAAIDDVADAFGGWVSGDDTGAPGQAVRADDDAPEWVHAEQGRLVAEADGVKLFVSRTESDAGPLLRFTLGDGNVQFDTPEGWAKRFEDHAVVVLGRAPMHGPDQGRAPLLGLTARSVAKVELHYAEGAPDAADSGDGGFVLLGDAGRPWRELVAYDRAGQVLERAAVSMFSP
jgi:hypothetical protein